MSFYRWNSGNFGTTECPCLGCGDRSITCHGDCEKYHKFKNKVAEINTNRKLEENRDWDTYNENIEKFKRRRRLVK